MRVTEGPFQWPLPDDEVQASLEAAFQDGSWGRYHGQNCEALVEKLQNQFECNHALLCSSGTIGVELALRGCGVESGDEVVLAGYDFPGNFRAIESIGARPVLVDVELDHWCLAATRLAEVNRSQVKAVVVSHLHGGLADMQAIMAVARQRGWAVVEDACQQPGAKIDGKPVGSWGDVGVLSFGGSKLLTAGRGGAVLTNDARIHQRIKIYSDRGNQAFPLSELQAAVLRPQLKKLAEHNRIRSQRVDTLRKSTEGIKEQFRPVVSLGDAEPAYYKFAWSLVIAENATQEDSLRIRDKLVAKLQALGVPIGVGFRGFTRRRAKRCELIGTLENCIRLSQSTLLLHHPMLLADEKATHQVGQVLEHEVQQLA